MKDLKKRRLKVGLSQVQLAHLTGIGRYNIGLCEQGVRPLMTDEKTKILAALKKQGDKIGKVKNKKK